MTRDSMLHLAFSVPGKPVGVNASYAPARWGKRHGFVKTAEAKAWANSIAFRARQRMLGCPPFGECEVKLAFFFPTKRNDVDSCVKGALDALQLGGVFPNDRLVQRLVVEKFHDKECPRLEVSVRALDGWKVHELEDRP